MHVRFAPKATIRSSSRDATDPFSKPFLEQIQLGGEATGTAINPIARGSSGNQRDLICK